VLDAFFKGLVLEGLKGLKGREGAGDWDGLLGSLWSFESCLSFLLLAGLDGFMVNGAVDVRVTAGNLRSEDRPQPRHIKPCF
jgi:hypothetical protein